MPMSDGERAEALAKINQLETHVRANKGKADADLYEALRHIYNILKIVLCDKSTQIE